jgi:peptide/nickel transport system permease protein
MTQTLPAGSGGGGAIAAADSADEAKIAVAPQWKLVWWGFKKHKLAMAGAIVTLLVYLIAIFSPFLATYSTGYFKADYAYAPPQRLHVVDDGKLGLYVYGYRSEQHPETLALTWSVDETKKIPVKLFAKGEEYKLFGVIPSDTHFIGPAAGTTKAQPMYLLGADKNGHDLLSRIIHGSLISMSIGLIGVFVSFILGILLGGLSGFFGGAIDTAIQRVIEFFMAVPTLPLWLGLAAAIPQGWGPFQRYFAITVILSLIGWTDIARVVRGKFLGLRQEEFVMAAQVDGATQGRIIFRHMLPSFTSHLIASLSLSIPGMILAETSLSFLGLGLQEPAVSWGVLLQQAQQIRVVQTAPWLLIPGACVVIVVLALNFFGDGMRDAADPYKN